MQWMGFDNKGTSYSRKNNSKMMGCRLQGFLQKEIESQGRHTIKRLFHNNRETIVRTCVTLLQLSLVQHALHEALLQARPQHGQHRDLRVLAGNEVADVALHFAHAREVHVHHHVHLRVRLWEQEGTDVGQ